MTSVLILHTVLGLDLSALLGPAPLTRYKDIIQFSSPLYRSEIPLSIGQKRGASNPLHLRQCNEYWYAVIKTSHSDMAKINTTLQVIIKCLVQ